MTTTLEVRNLDEDVVRKLNERATKNGRSSEAELRQILNRVLLWDTEDPLDSDTMSWEERAARLRRMTCRRQITPSEVLIREDRDSR